MFNMTRRVKDIFVETQRYLYEGAKFLSGIFVTQAVVKQHY